MPFLPSHPSRRRLALAWGLLTVLTLAGLVAAGQETGLNMAQGMAVTVVGAFKAREILGVYLNLRRAPMAWRGLLAGFVVLILGLVLAGHAGVRGQDPHGP